MPWPDDNYFEKHFKVEYSMGGIIKVYCTVGLYKGEGQHDGWWAQAQSFTQAVEWGRQHTQEHHSNLS